MHRSMLLKGSFAFISAHAISHRFSSVQLNHSEREIFSKINIASEACDEGDSGEIFIAKMLLKMLKSSYSNFRLFYHTQTSHTQTSHCT